MGAEMYRLALIFLLVAGPSIAQENTAEKIERLAECADHREMIQQWDTGDHERILKKYGSYSESVVRSARFILHMRISDPNATNGFRYHCPEEYHVTP